MMNNNDNEDLRAEVIRNTGNVSVNFKYFKFRTLPGEETTYVFKFPFPKYRSYNANRASVFYKHISRTINF